MIHNTVDIERKNGQFCRQQSATRFESFRKRTDCENCVKRFICFARLRGSAWKAPLRFFYTCFLSATEKQFTVFHFQKKKNPFEKTQHHREPREKRFRCSRIWNENGWEFSQFSFVLFANSFSLIVSVNGNGSFVFISTRHGEIYISSRK